MPYVLVGGDAIATDWDDLVDGTLAAPVDHDETGASITAEPLFAWTGTSSFGETISPCCGDWLDEGNGAGHGSLTHTDQAWSFQSGQTCSMPARLYCFEQ